MTFPNNNSRNIANLLKFQPLQPIKPRNNPIVSNSQIPQPRRQQIPLDEVFTPQQGGRNNFRRRTPLSSGGNNQAPNYPNVSEIPYRVSNRDEDPQLESFKVRLDQIVRYYDERHNHLQSRMMIKLNELQNFVMKEVPKIDNTAMLSSDIISLKEMMKDVRKQQQYQIQQINTLKVLQKDKKQTEFTVANTNKQKQKLTVLFMQTVRLGDSVQKITQAMNSYARNYQLKVQQLSQKLSNAEKNLAITAQRNSTGSDFVNQLGEKMMNRLQAAQSNLLILGKQQVKDKEALSKLASQNERIGEDVQSLLRNMQGDFQNRLDNRISETINRLMFEHQQRLKAQEQIRKNLDMRERIVEQKQINDKLQNKARYQNMDSLVRNQFLKKQQSIRALSSAMQQQFRVLMKEIQSQGGRRKEQQAIYKAQLKRVQQNFRKQYDVYKNHQSDLVQKITDMIKAEIQVRLSSELDLKKLTSDIANQLVGDLNNIKQALSNSNKKLNLSIREVSNESADRSGQLSHYIDSQIKKVVDIVTQKYAKMKGVFTKLAEQFKAHLMNTQTNRKNVQSRLVVLEQDFHKLKTQVNTEIEDFYNDLESRLKQQKQYVQTFVFKKNNDLSIRVNKLEEYVNQYFELLKTGIEDNKELLNNKIAKNEQQASEEDREQLKQLRTIVFKIRQLAEAIKTENQTSIRDLKKQIDTMNKGSRQSTLEMKNQLLEKINKHNQKTNELEEQINQMNNKINSLRTDDESKNAMSNQRVKKLVDELDSLTTKVKDVEEKVMTSINRTQEDVVKLRTDVTVLKGQVGALDDDIKKLHNA